MSHLTVKVVYFGVARDIAGSKEEKMTLSSPASVSDLLAEAGKKHAALGPLRNTIRVAIDQELVPEDSPLRGGETVVILPPVAGG